MTYFASVFRDQVKYSFKRMAKGVIVIGIMVLGLAACEQEKKPAGILSENQMVKVLTEIYLIEEKVGRLPLTRDSIEKVFPRFREKVMTKSKVSDSVFVRSMSYYMANPAKLEHIYTALVDSLSLRSQAAVVDSTRKSNAVSH